MFDLYIWTIDSGQEHRQFIAAHNTLPACVVAGTRERYRFNLANLSAVYRPWEFRFTCEPSNGIGQNTAPARPRSKPHKALQNIADKPKQPDHPKRAGWEIVVTVFENNVQTSTITLPRRFPSIRDCTIYGYSVYDQHLVNVSINKAPASMRVIYRCDQIDWNKIQT